MAGRISVLMGVYNGEAYLEETMENILEQTYSDWECIVVDDCSSDSTPEILARYAQQDARVRVYRNEKNMRLPATLNRALELAQGEYILRMDADDLCRKDRFERQVAFMDAHPEFALCSCKSVMMTPDMIRLSSVQRSTQEERVKALFLFFQPIIHPGVIARREDMLALRYNPSISFAEDLDLWTRMIRSGRRIAMVDEHMHMYRIHGNQVSVVHSNKQRDQYREIIIPFYREMLFELSEEELAFLEKGIYFREELDVDRFCAFIRKVFRVNRERGKFDQNAVMYAAFEVVMAYRVTFSLSAAQKLKLMSLFPPVFTVGELLRRKQATARMRRNLAAESALWNRELTM